MELRLERGPSNAECTIGQLTINGTEECWILEDPVRPPGVWIGGATAIPAGRYKVVLTVSERAQRGTLWCPAKETWPNDKSKWVLPLLVDIPGHQGIRIHAGNRAADTVGCLITGQERGENVVSGSRPALIAVMAALEAAQNGGEACWLTILDPRAGVIT